MRLGSAVRIILGISFMMSGFIKTKRFGKRVTPELWESMGKELKKMDKGLQDFPGRKSVPLSTANFQELFGYIDLICGFLLLTGNLQTLATSVLLIMMIGLLYTMNKLSYPMQYQAVIAGYIVALCSVCTAGGSKVKED